MNYDSRNFMIISTDELDSVDFNQVIETSADTVRKSIDGTLTFVKWDGERIPSSITALQTKEGPYTYEEMVEILASQKWAPTKPVPPIEELIKPKV